MRALHGGGSPSVLLTAALLLPLSSGASPRPANAPPTAEERSLLHPLASGSAPLDSSSDLPRSLPHPSEAPAQAGGNELPAVTFSDQATEAGLLVRNVSGGAGKEHILETTGAGACFLDYDLDGDVDLYVVNGATVETLWGDDSAHDTLYRNDGGGRFTDVTSDAGVRDGGWGGGCAAGDYDNDGDPDLYVTNFGLNVLLRNDGDGGFSDVTAAANVAGSSWSLGAAFLDVEPDGDLDLYVANYLRFTTGAGEPARGACTWKGIPVMCGPRGYAAEEDVLYLNDGKGAFRDASIEAGVAGRPLYGMGVVAGDVDADGDTDLFVANDSQDNHLFLNDGAGRFADGALWAGVALSGDGRQQASMGADLGDYDNDGDEDLFVTNFSDDYHTLYRNEGGGIFLDVTDAAGLDGPTRASLGWGGGFFDYDNDGDLDLFVASGHVYPQVDGRDPATSYRQQSLLFRNDGDGSFTDVTNESGPGLAVKRSARGAAFGDYDDDGDVDIALVNENALPALLRNDGGNALSWISLRLIGSRGNRDGIGARVRLQADGRLQFREVRLSSGYASSHDPRIHFGLGGASKVDRIEIRWPSGRTQIREDLPGNHLVLLREDRELAETALLGRGASAPSPEQAAAILRATPSPVEPRPAGVANASSAGAEGAAPRAGSVEAPVVRADAAADALPPSSAPSRASLPAPSGGRLTPEGVRRIEALAQTGTRRIAAGDHTVGVGALQEAIRRLPPESGAVRSHDALGFGNAGRYRAFLAALYDNLGVGLMRAERLEACAEALDRAIALDPARGVFHHNLGLCHFHGRRYGAAVAELREAREAGDAGPSLSFDLARALASAGLCDEALGELERAVAGGPPLDPEGRAAEGWYRAGSCFAGAERHGEAVSAFREALDLVPGHQRALYRLGVSMRSLGRTEASERVQALFLERQTEDEAARSLERAGPRTPGARLSLARDYLDIRLPDEAFVEVRRALAMDPASAPAHVLLGQVHLAARHPDLGAAEEAFRRALDVDAASADAMAGLGEAALKRGRIEEAERWFLRALALSPAHGAASVGRARALEASGRTAEAAAALRERLEKRGNDEEALLALASLHASAPRRSERRPADALRLLGLAGALYGEEVPARVSALLALGRREEARALVEDSPFLGRARRAALLRDGAGLQP